MEVAINDVSGVVITIFIVILSAIGIATIFESIFNSSNGTKWINNKNGNEYEKVNSALLKELNKEWVPCVIYKDQHNVWYVRRTENFNDKFHHKKREVTTKWDGV